MREGGRAGVIYVAPAAMVVCLAMMAMPASAQQLGKRKAAPPSAESKVSRIVARAELQAKQQGGSSLKSEQLTVTKSCGNVQVGGTQAATDQPRPTSLLQNQTLRNENVTVARDTVNICR